MLEKMDEDMILYYVCIIKYNTCPLEESLQNNKHYLVFFRAIYS